MCLTLRMEQVSSSDSHLKKRKGPCLQPLVLTYPVWRDEIYFCILLKIEISDQELSFILISTCLYSCLQEQRCRAASSNLLVDNGLTVKTSCWGVSLQVFCLRDVITIREESDLQSSLWRLHLCEFCWYLLHLGFWIQLAKIPALLHLLHLVSGKNRTLHSSCPMPQGQDFHFSPKAGWIINKAVLHLPQTEETPYNQTVPGFDRRLSAAKIWAAPRQLQGALCGHCMWRRHHLSKWTAAAFPWPWEAFWCRGRW